MTLVLYALLDWAQIVTAAGVPVAIFLSVKGLREIIRDRNLSQKPFLVLDNQRTTFSIGVLKKEGGNIEMNSLFEKKTITFGTVRNVGNGSAIQASMKWIPKNVYVNDELKNSLLSDSNLFPKENIIPFNPSHIRTDQTACIWSFPKSFAYLLNSEIGGVQGEITLSALDIFGRMHITRQILTIIFKREKNEFIIAIDKLIITGKNGKIMPSISSFPKAVKNPK